MIAARPYAEKVREVLGDLSEKGGDSSHPLQEKREVHKVSTFSSAAIAAFAAVLTPILLKNANARSRLGKKKRLLWLWAKKAASILPNVVIM